VTHIKLKSAEFDLAVFTHLAPVGAHVTQVIVEGKSRNLLLAVQMARNGIQGARQQMSLIINDVN
jgi:hypothetical protein